MVKFIRKNETVCGIEFTVQFTTSVPKGTSEKETEKMLLKVANEHLHKLVLKPHMIGKVWKENERRPI